MKNRFFKAITSFLVLTLVMSALSPTIMAQSNTMPEADEKEVQELAEALEFVFEQAMLKDEFGETVGVDFEKIEEKYGSNAELTNLVNAIEEEKNAEATNETGEITITPYTAAVDACIERKVKDYFTAEDFIPTSIISTVIALIGEKNYTGAAMKLIKAGFKGNAAAIGATLASFFFTCLWEEEGW